MTPDEYAQTARRYVDVFNSGDATAIDGVLAPEATLSLNDALLGSAVILKQRVGGFRAAFPDGELTVQDVLVAGDRVVVRYESRGTHLGELRLGNRVVPPTGKAMHCVGVMLLHIVDGRVIEEWTVADVLSMMQQLGAIPDPT